MITLSTIVFLEYWFISKTDQYEKLQKENQEIQVKYFEVRQKFEELQEKMRFFTKESAVDFQELEEALIIVKVRKHFQCIIDNVSDFVTRHKPISYRQLHVSLFK